MEDLISYSFQVARGMEFLSSRKVSLAFYCFPSLPGPDMWTLYGHTHLCSKSTLPSVCLYLRRVNTTPSALIFPDRTEEPRIPVSRNWILGENLARLQTRQTWRPFSTLPPGIFSKLARISEYTTSPESFCSFIHGECSSTLQPIVI